ncbi:uncharacterized protein BDZ99DRAFT_576370 [Mytilinidion resinicola]|uniref:Uncharacterized protein n=1 Tax=Mytilinidion resinicola TaxID=574789 RepID=A0A6A6Y2S0_9PEZI|nr:uncharacterized protein BDZ99DRAFT_576370 [Mytilinidion resinicola]KAF2803111.1 hypothetical protein BDZ99DRAFT_576370 [Mytilinidion resinicola]
MNDQENQAFFRHSSSSSIALAPLLKHPASISSADVQEPHHVCLQRHDESGFLSLVRTWWLAPAHLFCTILLACTVQWSIRGTMFPVYRIPHRYLTQSDVTTLLSVGLKITSIFTTAWQSITAWRCAFIALEKTGLQLSQLSNQISFKTPVLRGDKTTKLLGLVLLLGWPAQLASPILSGAITWVPTTNMTYGNITDLQIARASANATDWDSTPPWYRLVAWDDTGFQPATRLVLLQKAAGSTLTILRDSTKYSFSVPIKNPRRFTPEVEGYTLGSTVQSIIMPTFEISNLTWLKIRSIPQEIQDAVHNKSNAYFNFGDPDYRPNPPVVGLIRKPNIGPLSSHTLPPNSSVNENTYAVYRAVRYPNHGNLTNCSSEAFDGRPSHLPDAEYLWVNGETHVTDCYAVAGLHINAGVVACQSSRATLVAPSVLECIPHPGEDQFQVLSDPLTQYSLSAITGTISWLDSLDVMTAWSSTADTAIAATISIAIENGLRAAYEGFWSALTNSLSSTTDPKITIDESASAVIASVATWRVILWAALNTLLTFASILLWRVQSSCIRPPVKNPVLTSILLDSSKVIEEVGVGLCNANRLTKNDDGRGRLRLRCIDRSDPHWYHDQLEME